MNRLTEMPFATAGNERPKIFEIYRRIQGLKPKLVEQDGGEHKIPRSLYSFLLKLTSDLNEGKTVSIVRDQSQLTTIEASKMLGVSRQFLVNCLERGEIPFHRVGTHRRLYVKDLLEYKAKRDRNRRKILDELARAEREDGLYDLVPPHAE